MINQVVAYGNMATILVGKTTLMGERLYKGTLILVVGLFTLADEDAIECWRLFRILSGV